MASTSKTQPTEDDKREFLKEDLRETLKELVVGAVMWQAAKTADKTERCPHQAAVGMFTAYVQARALYEFFYKKRGSNDDDDARASDFTKTGKEWAPSKVGLLDDYLGEWKPANKRIFHLVYWRSKHSGGTGNDGGESDLNNQVLKVTCGILKVTGEFVKNIHEDFDDDVRSAWSFASEEARKRAKDYGILNPLEASFTL